MFQPILGSLHFSPAIFWAPRLSPRLFGEPTSRTRAWRILYNPGKMTWNCVYSFSELVEILLLPVSSPMSMTPSVFLTATNREIQEHSRFLENLSPSEAKHLNDFQRIAAEKQYYDLASNPTHRRRTETADGALMTLTTNSHIWQHGSERHVCTRPNPWLD